jgi:glycosyltransferase involved in cell wall biosynthesis
MPERLRILLLIPHLGGGGAEQVTALLARGLSREKYEVHLGLVTQAHAVGAEVPPWVSVHALGAPRVRAGALRLLRLVWQLRPDVILSGMAHLNFLVLLLRPFFPAGTRVLVRQNATVSAVLADGSLPRYTRLLYRMLYRHADRVICQSRAMAEDLAGELGIASALIAVLPNPVDLEGILAAKDDPVQWSGAGPHLLAVGRLSPEKGFDLLLRALVSVRERFPAADLVIAGAGPEEAALKAECRRLGLEAAVRFAGRVDRPYALFPGAALFVLSSRHEGMPNALLEAAASGLPIVALPASGGVVDLLRGRPGAWLAPEISSSALAASLLAALEALQPGERFPHFLERNGSRETVDLKTGDAGVSR